MTALAERTRAALDPLRDALLADARAEARSVEASAEADGWALLESARRQRETVLLRYLGDQSEQQTAAALGISVGSVKTHASRGLAALREVIER